MSQTSLLEPEWEPPKHMVLFVAGELARLAHGERKMSVMQRNLLEKIARNALKSAREIGGG